MKRIIFYFNLALSCFILSACANGYVDFYKPYDNNIFQPNPNVEVYTSNTERIYADVHEFGKRNYYVMGEANFWGVKSNAHNIYKAASERGADVVLYLETYRNTTTGSAVIALPDTQTTSTQGSVNTSGGFGTYSGTTTTRGTKLVPITTTSHYYDHTAVFLKKNPNKLKIGIRWNDCNEEQRKKLGDNNCVFVRVVLYDTPAFRQNIMEGDIVRKINNANITNIESVRNAFNKDIDKNIFNFEMVRDSKNIKVVVDTTK